MQEGRENSIDEVGENMYKLLRYRKSVKSIEENGGHTSDEVEAYFVAKRGKVS